jgi:polar amino acid transport system substrate-binding protein
MRKPQKSMVIALLLVLLSCTMAVAETYKVAILQISATNTMVDLAKALADAQGVTFDIQVVPSARAVYLIENNQVDLVFPRSMITDPEKLKELKYDVAEAVLSRSAYVLYTNKLKSISPADLKKGNPKGYKIETAIANVDSWEFKALPSTNIEGSLKKIDSGAIDGYLYSQLSTDPPLKTLGLKSIKRQLYSYSQLGFNIQKGKAGSSFDKLISEGMKKIRADGTYDKIMGDLVKTGEYIDWQP